MAELQLFRGDEELYRRARLHELLSIVAVLVYILFCCAAVGLRVECAGLQPGTKEYVDCQQTFNAEANVLNGIVLLGGRYLRYTRSMVLALLLAVATFATYFVTNDRAWEHTACFLVLMSAQLVARCSTDGRTRAWRERFEHNVERRAVTLLSAKLKKQTKEALAAQVPPGAGTTRSLIDRDGIWGATTTMAVCGLSVVGFNEWVAQAGANDAVSLLLAVFGATDDALVASGTAAARYALGDCYDVGLTRGEAAERAAQLRGILQFAVLAAVATTSTVDTDAEQRFVGVRRERHPMARMVLHVGSGCSGRCGRRRTWCWAARGSGAGRTATDRRPQCPCSSLYCLARSTTRRIPHHCNQRRATRVSPGSCCSHTQAVTTLWDLHNLPLQPHDVVSTFTLSTKLTQRLEAKEGSFDLPSSR